MAAKLKHCKHKIENVLGTSSGISIGLQWRRSIQMKNMELSFYRSVTLIFVIR